MHCIYSKGGMSKKVSLVTANVLQLLQHEKQTLCAVIFSKIIVYCMAVGIGKISYVSFVSRNILQPLEHEKINFW